MCTFVVFDAMHRCIYRSLLFEPTLIHYTPDHTLFARAYYTSLVSDV